MAYPVQVATEEDIRTAQREILLRNLPYEWWKDPNLSVMYKLMDVLSLPVAKIARELEAFPYMRSVEYAWDFALDVVGRNVGVKRIKDPEGVDNREDDMWYRERIKLAIYIQHMIGSPHEIQRALAWYIGIYRKNINWEDEYLPQIDVVPNQVPFFPYETAEDVPHLIAGKNIPYFLIAKFPWTLVDKWRGDGLILCGDPGEVTYQTGAVYADETNPNGLGKSGGIAHGHHLLLDLVDLADILSMSGVKLLLWGLGWNVMFGTDDPGGPPFQDLGPGESIDYRMSGPVDLHGATGIYDLYTHPNGMLQLNLTTAPVYAYSFIHSNGTFSLDTGKRIFRNFNAMEGGGAICP